MAGVRRDASRPGFLRPDQLKDLLSKGYGAVIQGEYGKIPRALRLQKDFLGGHAIYLDGYYPGNPDKGIPEAYYVIDPHRPAALGLRGRLVAVVGGRRVRDGLRRRQPHPGDVGLPAGRRAAAGQGPARRADPARRRPGADREPGRERAAVRVADPRARRQRAARAAHRHAARRQPDLGGQILIPILEICLVEPLAAGCPTGVQATFQFDPGTVLQLPPGPTVSVVFVDSDRPNVAIIGFTVDPPATSTVRYWQHDGSPATVMTPASMSSDQPVRHDDPAGVARRARLDHVRLPGGRGERHLRRRAARSASSRPATASMRSRSSLSQATSPTFALQDGLSPYLHLAPESYAIPLVKIASLGGSACGEELQFGGVGYCADIGSGAPPPSTCTRAEVTTRCRGATPTAWSSAPSRPRRGRPATARSASRACSRPRGPVPSGDVSVGCLASGLTYHIVLDGVGDDRGILASSDVTVP